MDISYIVPILLSGLGVAVTSGIFTLLGARYTSRAIDSKELKESIERMASATNERLDKFSARLDSVNAVLVVILQDRIKQLAEKYIREGTVSFSDRSDLKGMVRIYKHTLGGNGTIDGLIAEFDKKLPYIEGAKNA